jgi:hypothetical protein
MGGAVLIAVGMVAGGLFLVASDTKAIVHTGRGNPILRMIGQVLALLGGLCLLGFVIGG